MGLFDDLLASAQRAARMRAESEQGFPEASRAFLAGTADVVIPQTPEDIGLTIAAGPFSKLKKLGGLAIAGLGYSPDASAASGGLAQLASRLSPGLGRIYGDAVTFGKQFPRASEDGEGDAARHAYASSRVAREYGPNMAKVLGWLNEATAMGADRRATRMDDFNNAAGLSLADLEDAAAKQKIAEMLKNNQLQWLKGNIGQSGYADGGMIDPNKRGSCGKLCSQCAKRHNCNHSCGN